MPWRPAPARAGELAHGAALRRQRNNLIDRLAELLPHAERAQIPGASHIMHEDNAKGYNTAVSEFLTRHAGTQPGEMRRALFKQ